MIKSDKYYEHTKLRVDNTLTDTPPFSVDEMDLEETRKMIRNAPLKKGIEILSILDLNNYNRKR